MLLLYFQSIGLSVKLILITLSENDTYGTYIGWHGKYVETESEVGAFQAFPSDPGTRSTVVSPTSLAAVKIVFECSLISLLANIAQVLC